MIDQYNTPYLLVYEKYKQIMNTDVIIIGKKNSQNYQPIFKLKGLPSSVANIFDDKLGDNTNKAKITFLKDDLVDVKTIDGLYPFPINEILSKIETIRFNNQTFAVIDLKYNVFNNLISLILNKKL